MDYSEIIKNNTDLKKLDNEYAMEIQNGFLLVRNIPYVDSAKNIHTDGVLVSNLTLSGIKTQVPQDHICHFQAKSHPCTKNGILISSIQYQTYSPAHSLFAGFQIQFSFSNKPQGGYKDYHHKMSTYIAIIENEARALDENITAKKKEYQTKQVIESPFKYEDTNSSRANISNISDKLRNQVIGIIGLGGTGAYILDFLAKTMVKEIHLFDDDTLQNHNAFRTPGAPTIQILNNSPSKVSYLQNVYSNLKNGIYIHEKKIDAAELNRLVHGEKIKFDFIFVCIDKNTFKKNLFQELANNSIPFIDVGIGMDKTQNDTLLATVRTTLGNRENLNNLGKVIPFEDANEENIYAAPNIQISEINALNASLAVIRWKKFLGVYQNRPNCIEETHSAYNLQYNKILSEAI